MTTIFSPCGLALCLLLCSRVITKNRFSADTYWAQIEKSVTLTCDLSKDLQLIGFYNRNGQRIEIQDRFRLTTIDADNSYQLTILPVLANDFGEYTCLDSQNITSTAILYIEAWIKNFQLEYFAATGDTAKLQVNTGGYPPPTIEWKKLGTIFGLTNNLVIKKDVDGKFTRSSSRYTMNENGSLLISGASSSDVSSYSLTVYNGKNEQSNTTILKVGDKPVLTAGPPVPFNVSEGFMFRINCEFGNEESVKWTFVSKEGQSVELVETSRIKIDRTSLTVSLASRLDEGLYKATARNLYGMISAETSVLYVVEKGPIYVTDPLTVEQNTRFQLWCNSSGHPAPKFTWYHKNDTLKPKEGIVIKEDRLRSTVLVDSASTGLVGTFKCHVYYGDTLQGAVQGENTTSLAVRGVTKDQNVSCPLPSTFVLTKSTVYCRCQDGYVPINNECKSGKIFQVSEFTLGISWSPVYSQADSMASLDLNRQIFHRLQGQTSLSSIVGLQILGLRPGSVIARLLVVFDKTSDITAAAVLAALQKFLNASDQTEPKFLPSPRLDVKETTLCEISGQPCWSHSECALVNGTSQYGCVCMKGYSLQNNNQCVASNQITPTTTGSGKASSSDKLLPLYCVLGVLAFLALVSVGICYMRKGSILPPYAKQQSAESGARSFPQLESSIDPSERYTYADSSIATASPQHRIPATEYYSYPNFENGGIVNHRFNGQRSKADDPVYTSSEQKEGQYQELQERKEYHKPYSHYEPYRPQSGEVGVNSEVENQEGLYALYDASTRKNDSSPEPVYALYEDTARNLSNVEHRK